MKLKEGERGVNGMLRLVVPSVKGRKGAGRAVERRRDGWPQGMIGWERGGAESVPFNYGLYYGRCFYYWWCPPFSRSIRSPVCRVEGRAKEPLHPILFGFRT